MAVKTETLTIKVSPEEKARIRAAAAEKDWTISKYLYNLLIKEDVTDASSKLEDSCSE